MIELREVEIDIGRRPLLRRLDVRVESASFVAMLGPNGVGKTTLLRAIAGMHPPASGTIAVDGEFVADLSPQRLAQRVALVTADDAMVDALCVRDVVAIGRFPHLRWWQWRSEERDERAIDEALAAVRMQAYERRAYATLSSGERQRVWIAMGLAQETPILLLDEPTSHLDVRVAHEILLLLRSLADAGKTILCVLHDLNEAAAHADRILLLGKGRMLAYGGAADVLRGDAPETAYGIAMERIATPSGIRVFPAS